MSYLVRRCRRPFARRSPLRSLVAWTLLALYATTASGIPLPSFAEVGGGPHPCQGHRCGCATAKQCWKTCCCYTNRQKVAWAAEHGVTPPEFVVAAARTEAQQESPNEQSPVDSLPPCCRAKQSCCAKASACSHSHAAAPNIAAPNIDSSATADSKHAPVPAQPAAVQNASQHSPAGAPQKTSLTYVSLMEAQRCRGTTPTWIGIAISLPPEPPVRCPAFNPFVRPLAPTGSPHKPHAFSLPSVPPPRAA